LINARIMDHIKLHSVFHSLFCVYDIIGIFQRRILRKIFDPVQNKDGSWRIRMNYELNELIKNADIVRFIESRRIAWLGHVMRMDDKRTPKRILEWKPTGTRTRGGPRTEMDCRYRRRYANNGNNTVEKPM